MSNMLHRVTLQYHTSCDSDVKDKAGNPKWPPSLYIKNPQLESWWGAMQLVPKKYWKVVGDKAVQKNAAEKAIVDAADLVLLKTKLAADVRFHRTAKLNVVYDQVYADGDALADAIKVELDKAQAAVVAVQAAANPATAQAAADVYLNT